MNQPLSVPGLSVWSSEPLPDVVRRSLRRVTGDDDVQHVAVMPDIHLAQDVCNGTVVATSELVYPSAVGSDIGCGMTAARLEAPPDLLESENRAASILAGLSRVVPINRHSRATAPEALPTQPLETELNAPQLDKQKNRDGRVQLGTLGRGNHFLELQRDTQQRLWVLVHCGSRAMGQAITAHHIRDAKTSSGGRAVLSANTEAGRAYLRDVNWAIEYARQNRWAMLNAVEMLLDELFGVTLIRGSQIDSNHNHVLQNPISVGSCGCTEKALSLPASTSPG